MEKYSNIAVEDLGRFTKVAGYTQYLETIFPKVPKYVLKDMIYGMFKKDPAYAKKWKDTWLTDWNWKKETLVITLDSFDDWTKNKLQKRMRGENPDLVPRDTERHTVQKKRLQQGPSSEPIIVREQSDGYQLLEGWHRVIQSLLMWPKGFEQDAWVAYEKA